MADQAHHSRSHRARMRKRRNEGRKNHHDGQQGRKEKKNSREKQRKKKKKHDDGHMIDSQGTRAGWDRDSSCSSQPRSPLTRRRGPLAHHLWKGTARTLYSSSLRLAAPASTRKRGPKKAGISPLTDLCRGRWLPSTRPSRRGRAAAAIAAQTRLSARAGSCTTTVAEESRQNDQPLGVTTVKVVNRPTTRAV